MFQLSGDDRRALRKALVSGFQSYQSLDIFVKDNDFKFRLNEIAGNRDTTNAADQLIEACEERGDELVLILALAKERPRNSAVQTLMSRLQGRLPDRPIVAEQGSDCGLAPIDEDPRSSHLVVAVFWQKPSEQKLRVQPKLCYQNMETGEKLQESLIKDSCAVSLKQFPDFLKKLVDFAFCKLPTVFDDPIHPWSLTIELFVPLDLLRSPLTCWCGQDKELLKKCSIVLGCSDRFDPDKPGRSADLHNQLKRGWQRFQASVPDQAGLTLQNLTWLNSDIAHQTNFEMYAGFQCYGDWLKPDEVLLKNWEKLVRSGIPLALWMCEGQPQRATIEATYQRMINCNRFEFLDQIPMIREEQQRTCNHYVGVLYEDPRYVPDVPRAEAQFFSWPSA